MSDNFVEFMKKVLKKEGWSSIISAVVFLLIGILIGGGITLLAFKPNNSLIGYKKVDKNIQAIIDSYNMELVLW